MSAASVQDASMRLGALFPGLRLPDTLVDFVPTGIYVDSRAVTRGSVFCSLPSLSGRQQDYISQALGCGARVIVQQSEDGEIRCESRDGENVYVIEVGDIKVKTAELVHVFLGRPSDKLNVVGVTGTNGKTSCTDLLGQCWRYFHVKSATIGTLGVSTEAGIYADTGHTTMDVAGNHQQLAAFTEAGVKNVAMEVSSHGIDQGRINSVNFFAKVITNISRDHLDYHGTMENYAGTKLTWLEDETAIIVANADDSYVAPWMKKNANKKIISYAIKDASAQVSAQNIQFYGDGIVATLTTPWGSGELRTSLIGEFNLSNVLAVVAVLCAQGESLEKVLSVVRELKPVPGRIEKVALEDGFKSRQIYIDYAHTPDALEKVLKALSRHCSDKLICTFGCGGDRDKGKRPQMAAVAEANADLVLVTSDNPRSENPAAIINDVMRGFSSDKNVIAIEDRTQAICRAIDLATERDIVLLAGKGHENYQEIDGKKIPYSDYDEVRRLLAD